MLFRLVQPSYTRFLFTIIPINMFTQKNFYSSPASRYLMLLLAWMLCTIIGSFVMALVMGDGTQTGRMRIAIVVQDILMFILPALLTAVFITSRPAELLGVTRRFPPSALLLVFMIMVVSAPAMNILISFNQSLTLPESLKPIEEWMRHSEESAAHSLSLVTGSTSVGSLIISILIVGILAGFSEEIFFRGALQRIMATGGVSAHAAIWIAAFIFSAFHMQFFGFLPRLLLGAFFGYLLWWSGSLWLPVCAHALNNTMALILEWQRQRQGARVTLDASLSDNPDFASWCIILLGVVLAAWMIITLRWRLKKAAAKR